jgi:adenine phosphoribosyltransferase
VDVVAGFDSRGFLFGPAVAKRLNVAFTMIRKRGKLPPPTQSVSYGLEYGTDAIEMADDGYLHGKRVLLIDDLLATGGTAAAGVELVEKLGGTVVGFTALSELPALGGRGKLMNTPVYSLLTIMDGEVMAGVEYCVDVLLQSDIGEVLLIERLAEVPGIAMPGGRLEQYESVVSAACREMFEETSLTVKNLEYRTTLVGLNRDPRGPKVSVVVQCQIDTIPIPNGEPGKTRPFVVRSKDHLPILSKFVLDHGSVVHNSY